MKLQDLERRRRSWTVQQAIQKEVDLEDTWEWALTPEVRQTMPDILEYPEHSASWWLIAFYKSARP